MEKKFYVTYVGSEINKIRHCENCGSRRDLFIIPYYDLISIECDNCQHGKGLWRKPKESKINKSQLAAIEQIIEQALNEPDKELAIYESKAKLRKLIN